MPRTLGTKLLNKLDTYGRSSARPETWKLPPTHRDPEIVLRCTFWVADVYLPGCDVYLLGVERWLSP